MTWWMFLVLILGLLMAVGGIGLGAMVVSVPRIYGPSPTFRDAWPLWTIGVLGIGMVIWMAVL